MTEVVIKRPLVRPRFLKWSLAAFALLLPFVIHSVWDYVEARRLRALIAEITRKGELVRPDDYRPLTGGAAEAARYYRAAAVLASGFGLELSVGAGPSKFGIRVNKAEGDGVWPDDLVGDLRAMLDRYQDALMFVDRAAALPFEGLGGSFSELQSYLGGQLFGIQRLSRLRAELLALDGDGDRAVDSLSTATSITRALGDIFSDLGQRSVGSTLRMVLERTRPSAGVLERLSAALADLDRNDLATRRLVSQRALVIQAASRLGVTPGLPQRSTHLEDVIARPWNAHELNWQLDVFSRLILASQAPWPECMDRVVAVGEWPVLGSGFGNPADRRSYLSSDMVRQAQQIAMIRSMRAVVAVERYRRSHGEQPPARIEDLVPDYLPAVPIDPFSGKPLMLANEARGYVVYSVGANRQDDGGRDVAGGSALATGLPYSTSATDLGIRIEQR